MPTTQLEELIPVLQIAIAPVILISGVGLLLLSMTNRFGRAIDRSRQLAGEMREAESAEQQRLAGQIEILYGRARLIRLSIIAAAISVLMAAVLIISLFLFALLKVEVGWFIAVVFIVGMVALIVSLIAFIQDIHLSLLALKLELGHEKNSGTAV